MHSMLAEFWWENVVPAKHALRGEGFHRVFPLPLYPSMVHPGHLEEHAPLLTGELLCNPSGGDLLAMKRYRPAPEHPETPRIVDWSRRLSRQCPMVTHPPRPREP